MTKTNNQNQSLPPDKNGDWSERFEHTCTPNSGGCSGNCMCYCHNKTGDWEKRFSLFMNQHDNFLHGLDRSQIPYLKQFISDLLQEQKQKYIQIGEGMKELTHSDACNLILYGKDCDCDCGFYSHNQAIENYQERIEEK